MNKELPFLHLNEKPNTLIECIECDERSWVQRLIYNVGTMFILSGTSGATYGFINGSMTALPVQGAKIRLNTILNQMTTHGLRLGQGFGIVTLLYGLVDIGISKSELDKKIESIDIDGLQTGITGACTGLIYRAPRGMQHMGIASVLGFGTFYAFDRYKILMPSIIQNLWF